MTTKRPALLTSLLLVVLPCLASAEEIPLVAWVHDPLIASVGVSPDGNKLVALTLSDVNEPADITVWDINDLSKPPKRFAPPDVKAIVVGWINDDMLYVIGRQKYDYRIGGTKTKWFRDKTYLVDSKGKRFRTVLENVESVGTSLFNLLPTEPDKILVSVRNLEFAEDIYEVNVKTFLSHRVQRGATGESYMSDVFGEIRARSEIVGGGEDIRIEYSYVDPENGGWDEHFALYATEREGWEPAGFAPDGRTVYVLDNKGRDKKVVREYDLVTRQASAPIFEDPAIEATGVVQSRRPDEMGKLIGFSGLSSDIETIYIDPEWRTLQERLYSALPGDARHTIASYSDDFTVLVIRSEGPRRPPEYHLLVNGEQLIPLGSSYPYLRYEELADVQFVTYTARDGLEIPAYLTIPTSGAEPYPAVVLPHGGPWARDVLRFDYWVQFLANRGYVVIQPQFRGSEGWGQSLWRAGDGEWGQAMQDDNDDAALWLVENGIADPDRLAIFGYSYGGYAAMAAVVRPDTPFQCAIAGAAPELRMADRETFDNRFGREFQNPSIDGLEIVPELKNAQIPVHIFQGDRDQNVEVRNAHNYVAALEKADKPYQYTEIVDMWHSLPWWPQHHLAILEILENYLAEDCGPGGL